MLDVNCIGGHIISAIPSYRLIMRLFFLIVFGLACWITTPLTHADEALVEAAQDRLKVSVRYDGAYVRLDYPGGDVPPDTGVCTDVIIRSYRAAFGFDFQSVLSRLN